MMSVHDALEAWQEGEITTSRAMTLSGARDVLELYALAAACDVEIKLDLREHQARAVDIVTQAVRRVMSTQSPEDRHPGLEPGSIPNL